MILRSIRAEGLGCFADAFTAGPFAPGINVLHGPNGTGKTTLFRAVSLAFLEPHRGKSGEVQALRPWGRRLTPQVALEFEHSGRLYRARKRFLDGASSHVETREGDDWSSFAQGDSADEFLRELLQTDSEKPRYAKREYWGLAQVLWTTQGDLSLPSLAPTVVESVRGSIGAQLAAKDSAIDARVKQEYERFFSPKLGKLKSGRNGAPQLKMEAERDRLAGELQTAEGLLLDFERESERIEQVRALAATSGTRHEALAAELERLRAAAEVYDNLQSQCKERTALRDAAQTRHKAFRERIDSIEESRREIEAAEKSLATLAAELPALQTEADALKQEAGAADTAHDEAIAAEQQAREELRTADLAEEHARALSERSGISDRLARIAAARAEIQNANERKLAVHAPSDAQLQELRMVLAKETDAIRRLEMARVAVAFEPESHVQIEVMVGEEPGTLLCHGGERVVLAGTPNLKFAIPGVGRFEATGPVSDYEPIRTELQKHRDWLAAFSGQFGSADPEVLGSRIREVAQIDSSIQEAQRAIALLLAEDSEQALTEVLARCCERIQEIETEYPGWSAQVPDASAMIAAARARVESCAAERNKAEAAARTAQTGFGEAQSKVTLATERQRNLQDNLDRSNRLLAGYLAADGLTDEQRREALDQAAIQYDSCRVALERVDTELAKFEDDPGIQAKRVAAEIITAEEQARKAKEDLVRAETRIQGLVERRPYASVTEASERLAVLREQLEREQRRMNALALLHRILDEARAQMMTEVATPVERIATEYLEQICGCPIATIRLSETLAAEQVMPAALTDTGEPPVDLDRVSGGEREQIFFSTRLALGTQLAQRERQLVVLDDVLTSTDDERLDRICQLLTSVSERLQIVILTCHPERFANLPGANRIELLSAMGRSGKVAA